VIWTGYLSLLPLPLSSRAFLPDCSVLTTAIPIDSISWPIKASLVLGKKGCCHPANQSHSFPNPALLSPVGNASGLLLIIFSATMTNTGDADSKIWSRHWTFYVAILVPCLLGMIIALLMASLVNLKKPERM
jgi:hypothetical protein